MDDCIFCKIITGKIPAYKVFENENVFAFLDIHPINPGHVLVVPKTHTENFYNLDDGAYMELMNTVKEIAPRVKKALQPKRVGLIAAGFDVAHAHIHIVPMHDTGDITSKSHLEGNIANPSRKELEAVQQQLV